MIASGFKWLRRAARFVLRPPLMLLLLLLGFVLDFLCGWPFDLLCRLDRRRGGEARPARHA